MHMIYAIGCNVCVENLQTRCQEFLVGHNNNVSCIAVSRCGRYIASGQVTYMGFKARANTKTNTYIHTFLLNAIFTLFFLQADIILWDFESKQAMAKLSLHKVKVQDLAFSHNSA